jgi:alpha-tubulin suppressor-like RCC1 family protein
VALGAALPATAGARPKRGVAQATPSAGQSLVLGAWGANQYGQLGNNTEVASEVPVAVSEITELTQIASGQHHSLARLAGGTVVAWGANEFGQLGIGSTSGPDVCLVGFACSLTPVPVNNLTGVREVAAGANFSLALLSNGKVMAWGQGTSGQLGNGANETETEPVEVKALAEVVAIAAGSNYGMALLASGKVDAWGANEFGQLGNGTTKPSDEPVPVKGMTSIVGIASGANHAIARRSSNTVKVWGANESGQLGNGSTTALDEPTELRSLTSVTGVAAGGNHTLALLSNSSVKAWGANEFGQLGNGSSAQANEPVSVKGVSTATAIAAGEHHSLALLSGGTVRAWGNDESGQLGNGNSESRSEPVEVDGMSGATAISAGGDHSMAIGGLALIPSVTRVEPNHGSAAGGTAVVITGSNFNEITSVKFGNTPASTFKVLSETTITATSPAGTGSVPVTVATAEATSAITSSTRFNYGPTVSTVLPNRGLPTGETTITISGSELGSVSAVKFGSAPAKSFTVNSPPTTITAVSPPGAPGTVNVNVTNPNGTSPTTTHDQFLYTEPRWYRNLVITANGSRIPIVGFGQITLSALHHEISAECVNMFGAYAVNENRENTGNKGYGQVLTWWASGHAPSAEHTELSTGCRLNDEGVIKNEGWITPEAPLRETIQQGEVCIGKTVSLEDCPIKAGEPGAERELTSVVSSLGREPSTAPWNMELVPKEGGIRVRVGVPTEKGHSCTETPAPAGCVRMTLVAPGLGWQLPIEGSFEPTLFIGLSSALSPSALEFEGTKSGTLQSPSSILGSVSITGTVKFLGGQGQEMISAE